jgi:CheY-like chemotaxis protein
MSEGEPSREAVGPPDETSGTGAACPLQGLAILVVDDVAAIRRSLAGVLRRAGALVRAFEDPHDALAAIIGDPDGWGLLVTDHDMPQMTGSELARAARAVAPSLPVLLCTALPDWHGHDRRDGALFDALVGKPARPEAILSGARAALDRRAAARA